MRSKRWNTSALSLAHSRWITLFFQSCKLSIIFILVKIAILVLGIVGLITYKGTGLVKTAAHVLLIVGGAVALIPLLGIAGGIVSIVGGALYLASLKNFKTDAQ